MRANDSNRGAYTLVEIMVVVAIIAILALMAMPAMTGARSRSQREMCRENLRLIRDAKHRYAMDNESMMPTNIASLSPTYLSKVPFCPAGGTYTLEPLTADPACTLAGSLDHSL